MHTNRSIRVRPSSGTLKGWWVIFFGIGSDGQTIEYACVDPKKREPFLTKKEALDEAMRVASYYLNDDMAPVPVIDEEQALGDSQHV